MDSPTTSPPSNPPAGPPLLENPPALHLPSLGPARRSSTWLRKRSVSACSARRPLSSWLSSSAPGSAAQTPLGGGRAGLYMGFPREVIGGRWFGDPWCRSWLVWVAVCIVLVGLLEFLGPARKRRWSKVF